MQINWEDRGFNNWVCSSLVKRVWYIIVDRKDRSFNLVFVYAFDNNMSYYLVLYGFKNLGFYLWIIR